MIFTLMGQISHAEVHSFKGRADCVVESRERVYIFEFKLVGDEGREGTGRALGQIEEKGYVEPYLGAGKKLVRIGVEYNVSKRLMGDWEVSGD
jgi:hypothetical protein